MGSRLAGKRVVVTQADDYMGPATIALFEAEVCNGDRGHNQI